MTASVFRQLLSIMCGVMLLLGAGCAQRGSRLADEPSSQYVVQPGDTLLSVAARFNIDRHDLVLANHLRRGELVPGQVLLLPGVAYIPPPPPVEVTVTEAPNPPAPVDHDTSWFLPRSTWAVEHIDMNNILPMTHIFRITVHHSGEEGDVVGEPEQMLRHFEHVHKASKGWACIGYHFIIAPDGRVFEGRPLRYQGAHAVGDNNIGNIGICLIGDFDRIHVPSEQREALVAVLDRLSEQYGIEKAQIFGHREFKATDCPGRYLMAIVEQYRGSAVEIPTSPVHATGTGSKRKHHSVAN